MAVSEVNDALAAPVRPLRWSARRIAGIYLTLAVLLVPWLIVLALRLPDREISQNYRLAWVGFDLMLLVVLARTAWLAHRRSPFLVNVASAAATMLIVDAWFDVTTAPSSTERWFAIAAAVLVELPLAALSMRIALRSQRLIASMVRAGARDDPG